MMLKIRFVPVVVLLAVICTLLAPKLALSADSDAATKVSTFAPAKDLASQADWYLGKLEESVASEDQYKEDKEKVVRDANTMIVVFLALGLNDEDSAYKAPAGALVKAAQDLAAASDFAAAKKAVAALKAAAESKDAVTLKWEKVAALPELMKQVPIVNNKLKLGVKPEKFKKKAKDTAGYTAVLAAIAQASMADTSATKGPEQVKQWHEFCSAMRDSAGALNAAIHEGDSAAAAKAMKKLAQSCDDCHDVFKK